CAAAFHHSRRSAWLVAAGALAVWAGLYSLDMGIYSIATLFLWATFDARIGAAPGDEWTERLRRSGLALAIGLLIGFAPFAVWCGYHGILGDFGYNTMIQLVYRHDLWSLPWPRLAWPDGAPAVRVLLLFYVMPGAILAAAW